MVEKIKAQVANEHDEVKALGGLYVVGTERHESRRIDNQLRGRSGRQGDPGESRFYLSLQDELMRLFKSDWVDRVLQVLKIPDDVPIENKRVTGAIANAQGQIESQNFESRKNVLKYDDVMDRQRHVIYGERRKVLEGADLEDQISSFIDDVVEGFVRGATEGFAEEWQLDDLWVQLRQIWPVGVDLKVLEKEAGDVANIDRDHLIEVLTKDAHEAYDRREAEVGSEVMRELERRVVLSVLDRKWREHLYEMDYLREGIYLRAYSQRDPLVEYQREGFDMFAAVMDGIKEESVGFLFNLEVQVEDDEEPAEEEAFEPMRAELPTPSRDLADPGLIDLKKPGNVGRETPQIRAKGLEKPKQPQNLSYSAPSEQGEVEVAGSTVTNAGDEFADVGRNQLCPCGSGKKYKRCHGAPGGPTGLTARVS
jgi:preprotein translocase subunit SecA